MSSLRRPGFPPLMCFSYYLYNLLVRWLPERLLFLLASYSWIFTLWSFIISIHCDTVTVCLSSQPLHLVSSFCFYCLVFVSGFMCLISYCMCPLCNMSVSVIASFFLFSFSWLYAVFVIVHIFLPWFICYFAFILFSYMFLFISASGSCVYFATAPVSGLVLMTPTSFGSCSSFHPSQGFWSKGLMWCVATCIHIQDLV